MRTSARSQHIFLSPCQYFSQFFHVQACKGKPNLHGHFSLSTLLGISHAMVFFCYSEDPLYGLLTFVVDFFHSSAMPDIFTCINIILLQVPCNYLLVVFALCTLGYVGASFTYIRITLVFPIALSVCCSIF